MGVGKQGRCVACERMFFADQVSEGAEEGTGLGWSECHCCGFEVGGVEIDMNDLS